MADQNPIYDFIKSNNLTDLDEKTFLNKYSAPDKAKEIYGFMVSNKLTDLDETKFYDKYLKKKVGGEEISLTESKLPLQGFSQEQINLLQTGAEPPKPSGKTGGTTIIPTNLTPDQKAYERELKRQDAAINTLKNTYKQKGLNFNEKSKRGQEQIQDLLNKEANNDVTLVTGKDQKSYLVRGEGFLESAGKGILRSITEPIESTKINLTNNAAELADLLDEKIKEEPNVPEGAPTRFGGYLGELAGGLPKMMALLAIPVAGESAMVGEMYHNALANQRRVLYEKGLQQGMDRVTAAKNAMQNAPITAIPDAIVGAAMARGIGGKAAGAEIIPNAAKESFLKATGNGLKGVAKVSGIGGAAEYGRSKAEQQLGYKVTDAEAVENGLRGMGEYAIMDAAFKLAHAGPKYLNSAAKNLLSNVPKEVLEVAAEKYPDGQQTLEDVAKFAQTKATVQDFVPEEKVASVTGLTEKVQNLENNIKELEEKKKTSSQALHPFMDGWIKEYKDEIDFYKKQVDKIVKSKDPTGVTEEIDDVTGLKAGQAPEIVQEKVEDITQFPETLKAKNKPTEIKEEVQVKPKEEKEVEVEKLEITKDDLKKAEAKFAAAKDKFEKAKAKVEATQVKQTGLFGGEQKGMFAMGGEEAKSTLDPLRKAVKEAKAELDNVKNRLKVQEEAQQELVPVEVPKKTYQEALKEKQEAEKKQTRQAAGEKAAISRRIFDRVFKMEVPEDAEQIALRYLADGGKVSKAAVDEAYGSVKRAALNTGRRELLSEEVKSKDFVGGNETLDEVAHRLWEESGQRVPESEIKDRLMAEIGNNNTRLEAAEAYLEQYNAEYKIEKEELRLAEQEKEKYLEEQEQLEKELRNELDEQIEGEESEEHINNLIKQYEAEIKAEDQQLRSESEGEINKEVSERKAVEKTSEEGLAKEYKEVVGKASKKAKENAKKDFVDRNFENLVEKLKIQIKCPT